VIPAVMAQPTRRLVRLRTFPTIANLPSTETNRPKGHEVSSLEWPLGDLRQM
jgi:hypothetical protein